MGHFFYTFSPLFPTHCRRTRSCSPRRLKTPSPPRFIFLGRQTTSPVLSGNQIKKFWKFVVWYWWNPYYVLGKVETFWHRSWKWICRRAIGELGSKDSTKPGKDRRETQCWLLSTTCSVCWLFHFVNNFLCLLTLLKWSIFLCVNTQRVFCWQILSNCVYSIFLRSKVDILHHQKSLSRYVTAASLKLTC